MGTGRVEDRQKKPAEGFNGKSAIKKAPIYGNPLIKSRAVKKQFSRGMMGETDKNDVPQKLT